MLSKKLVLATVLVCETSLANQYFIVRLWEGGRGYVCKKSTLCMFVKRLKIMDYPLLENC